MKNLPKEVVELQEAFLCTPSEIYWQTPIFFGVKSAEKQSSWYFLKKKASKIFSVHVERNFDSTV